MSKAKKIWTIAAASLILVGLMIFAGVMTVLKWDFTKLSTVKYETNKYTINESYQNISIVTDTADIVFVPSENAETSVVLNEQKKMKHSVSVRDGTLTIEITDTRKWYEYIGINFGTPKITVSLPKGEYASLQIKENTGDIEIPKHFQFESIDITASTGDVTNYASALESVKIKTSTGDIRVENITAGSLDLSASTGDITCISIACEGDVKTKVSTGKTHFTDVRCKNLVSNGTTGRILLKNVIATGNFSIERDTGNVKFEGCDAAEIFVKTDTGDVEGSLLTDKVFLTKTDTGRIRVPNSITGGRCEITTDTGNILLEIQK